MDIAEAEVLAKEELSKFPRLIEFGWRVLFETHYVQAGSCHNGRKVISISRQMTELNPPEEVVDTIRHEIAHAIVGGEHGHDQVWYAIARQIGCSGRRTHEAKMPPKQWMRRCSSCHRIRERKEALYEAYRSKVWTTGCCDSTCYWENDRTGEIRRCGE